MLLNQFNSSGYIHQKKVICLKNAEAVKDYLIENFLVEHTEALRTDPELCKLFPNDILIPKDIEKLKAIKAERSTLDLLTLLGTISTTARLNSLILELCTSDGILEIVKEIFQDEVIYLHLAPGSRIIHPNFTTALVPPHNDISYNQHISSDRDIPFITCWIPLQGIPSIDGGLKLYPNSKSKEIGKRKDNFWLERWATEVDEKQAHCPNYTVGDAIFFDPFLMHGSKNPSPASSEFRVSLDCRFFSSSSKSTKHYMRCSDQKVFEPEQGPAS